MVFFSAVVFIVIILGLGFAITRLVKESENFLERNLMRLGFGLATFVSLGLMFNLVRIPLDWKIFLISSLAFPLIYFFIKAKNFVSEIKNFKFKITKYDIVIFIMLIIFLLTFYMYAKGSFSYAYLEDDDPWSHAIGVKYVAIEKTVFTKSPIRYVDPYPPSYDMVLGILHQTNNSLYWTLKFFNALIISLSVIFFFFFAKELAGKNKALFSTFALASIPAFLSHFIWSIALSIPLYFVSFYALERIKHDKKWFFVAAVMISATLTISPTHSTYFALFFAIYYVIKAILEKNILLHYAAAGFFGFLISFFLWWLPSIIRHGITGTLMGVGLRSGTNIVSIVGTGDRIYNWRDFFIAQKTNMINNPVGIGLVLSLLLVFALISLIYKYYQELKKNKSIIFIIFLVIIIILLFFLSQSYVKYVPKKGVASLEKGSVPFFEFLFEQIFFVINLSVMILVIVALIVISRKSQDFKEKYVIIALAWLIFSFYAVNAGPFYYKLSPFRVWSIFSIPLAILVSEGMWFLFSFFKNLKLPKIIILVVVVAGVIATSAYQKYTVNTAQWPPGGFWTSVDEIKGYIWMKDALPSNTKVFTFVNNAPIIGLDKFICHWCDDIREYQMNGFNEAPQDFNSWMKRKSYTYVVIDGQTVKKFGANETNNKLQAMVSSGLFRPVQQTNGFLMLEVT